MQISSGVRDAVAVRPEQDGAGCPHPLDDCPFARPALVTALPQAGADRDDRPRAGNERRLDRLFERGGGHRDRARAPPHRQLRQRPVRGPPSTSPPDRLTRYTARRCSPAIAPRASQCPHFAESFDAPTTATERGSKSGLKSRVAGSGTAPSCPSSRATSETNRHNALTNGTGALWRADQQAKTWAFRLGRNQRDDLDDARSHQNRRAHPARASASRRAHAGIARDVRTRPPVARRRRRLGVPGARSVADLPLARRGLEGLGRRRQRDLRLPQRLRLDGAGTLAPGDRRAVEERVGLGHPFAAPTEDAVVVAEELSRRFGLPRWRFVNSGSEATMDAIRIARALTGRDTIVKIFGSYHGHHDYVMVSIGVEYDRIGDREDYASLPYGAGIPKAVAELTVARAVQRRRRDGAPDRAALRRGPAAGLRDHGGGDDEPRRRAPRARLPRCGPRADPPARHRADLRRGEDRARDRRRRRDRALRRRARPRHAREDARRRPAGRRDRGHRGGVSSASRTAASTRSAPTTATRWRWPRPARACSRC